MKKLIPKVVGAYLNFIALFSVHAAGRRAFNLFCSPKRATVKDYQQAYFDTSEKFKFEMAGKQLQAYKWGNGKRVLLFLHGWQSHTYRWKNYIEAFSKDEFTIYAMDAPASGLSEGKYLNIPIYANAIEKLLTIIPPVDTIISHSFGSISSLLSFYRSSIPVKNLVITGIPGEPKEYVEHFQKILSASKRVVKGLNMLFLEKANNPPEFYSGVGFVKAVTIPLLIIHDEEDDETPYKHAVAIHNAAPNSTLITTSGLGHNLRSASVVKHVVDFVNRPDPKKFEPTFDTSFIAK